MLSPASSIRGFGGVRKRPKAAVPQNRNPAALRPQHPQDFGIDCDGGGYAFAASCAGLGLVAACVVFKEAELDIFGPTVRMA
jgi:hypothetical protein